MKTPQTKIKSYGLLIALVLITFCYAFGRYLWGGEYFIFQDAGSDCKEEYYPTYIYIINQIREHRLSLWNNAWCLGEDTLSSWLMDPFAILLIFIGVIMGEQVVAPLLVISQFAKVILSALLAYKFLQFYRIQNNVRIMGAYLYGFNSFLMVWGQHYWYGAASIYILLLLIAIEKWIEATEGKNKWLLVYSASVGFVFFCNPYFAYMSIIMSSIYACVRYIYLGSKEEELQFGQICKNGFWLVAVTLLGIMMASIIFFPFIDINMGTSARISTDSIWSRILYYLIHPYDLKYYVEIIMRFISSNSMGINALGGGYYGLPELSVSIVGLPFIIEGILSIYSKMKNRKEKIVFFTALFLILFVIFIPLGSCIFNAFQYPFGRYTFVILPILVVVFTFGLDRICNENKMNYLASGLSIILITGIIVYFVYSFENESSTRAYDKFIIFMNVCTLIVMFLVVKLKKNFCVIILFLFIIIGCAQENYLTNSARDTLNDFAVVERERTADIIGNLKQNDKIFYRIEKTYHDYSFIGESIIEGYASTGGYCATLNRNLIRFYEEIWPEAMTNNGTKVTTARDYITEENRLRNDNILTLLGVKYILTFEELPDTGRKYQKIKSDNFDVLVYQNMDANSIVTGFNKVITETEFERFSQEERNRIIKSYLVLSDEEAVDNPYYVERVEISNLNTDEFDNDYLLKSTKDSHYQGKITVDNEKLLLFAIPYRTGWNIYIDGKKVDNYKADYGFIACQISEGSHEIEVKYENRVYLVGAFFSLIGIAIWISLFLRFVSLTGLKRRIQKISFINNLYTRWKWRERKVSYGHENPDKTFFVIRRAYCKVGLFSLVMTSMGLVDYAIKRGYIPVIDLQNTNNTYLEPSQVGKVNAWEFYFRQPMGYGLEDIKKSQNIILSNGIITNRNDYPDIHIIDNKEQLGRWRKVFQNYFSLNHALLVTFETEKRKLFGDNRVLGVLARGTDYVNSHPKDHPIQPSVAQIIEKAEEVMDKYQCTHLFLATEDQNIYSKMKQHFGEQLLAVETIRYTTVGNQNINDICNERKNDKFLKGKEYLFAIWLLSKCTCLVAGNVGGTHGALLMSKGYEYSYVFNLGLYE